MKKYKRVLSLALALVMALALVPTAAFAAEITVTEVVPCKYNHVRDFSEGLATVCVPYSGDQNKYGFIDKTGTEVLPIQYIDPRNNPPSFRDGLVMVYLEGKWGFIDTTGKEVVPYKYDWVGHFSEGLAAVKLDDKFGYIDQTGKEVVPCKYDYACNFSEGLAAVELDYKWGFIDTTGKEVVPCKYPVDYLDGAPDYFPSFSEGLAAVEAYTKDGFFMVSKYGYIDQTGKEVVPCKYDYACNFSEGLAAVELDYKWGFIDTTGKEVVPCTYGSGELPPKFSEGLAAVRKENKYGFIDTTGKEVVPCKYDRVGSFSEGLAEVAVLDSGREKWGFIDKTGKEVVPCKYDRVGNFSEGLAAVEPDGKWGFIDKTGKEVVPCKYDYAHNFSEGLAAVELDRKWGFISVDGTVSPAANTAYASTQSVNVDGKAVTFECYALKDENGNLTNYIKLRDLALLLNGSAAQFQVGWDGSVTITTKTAYTPNGSELSTPYTGDREYQETSAVTKVNGQAADLSAFVLNDDQGGGYTYYQLRDVGKALGFNVGWSADKGVFLETNKPYDPAN